MYKEEYKKMMDEVAENACTVTAEDILARANIVEMENGMKNKNVKHTRKFIGVATACAALVLTSTVALAATQKDAIAEFFRNIFHDEITAEIVDDGYLFEIGESHSSEDGKYDVDFIAVTGDYYNPVVLMDIHVNDENMVNKYDILQVNTYFLIEEVYENSLENYGPEVAYAYKDENDANLYHLSTRGTPYWFQPGEKLVMDVCGVFGVKSDHSAQPYDMRGEANNTSVECRIVLPETAMAPTVSKEYEDEEFFEDGDYKFYLAYTEFSEYGSDVRFELDYSDEFKVTKFENDDGGFIKGQPINTSWNNISNDVVLLVDGQEYKPIKYEGDFNWVCYNSENNRCYVWLSFDGIDYDEVEHISIKAGDKEIVIK